MFVARHHGLRILKRLWWAHWPFICLWLLWPAAFDGAPQTPPGFHAVPAAPFSSLPCLPSEPPPSAEAPHDDGPPLAASSFRLPLAPPARAAALLPVSFPPLFRRHPGPASPRLRASSLRQSYGSGPAPPLPPPLRARGLLKAGYKARLSRPGVKGTKRFRTPVTDRCAARSGEKGRPFHAQPLAKPSHPGIRLAQRRNEGPASNKGRPPCLAQGRQRHASAGPTRPQESGPYLTRSRAGPIPHVDPKETCHDQHDGKPV